MPEISVIIPIYNTEDYLRQCIESVINQTFKDLEIILVDDGSTDNSLNICREYEQLDSRIKVIHKTNGGLVQTRKTGIAAATGKYVGFVDSDDWIEPEMYQYMYDKMNEYGTDIVEAGIIDNAETYSKIRTSYFPEGFYRDKGFAEIIVPKLIYNGNFFEHGITPYIWNKLFIKSKLEEHYMKMADGCNKIEDATCVYPYVISTENIYISKKAFYHYRVRTSSDKRTISKDITKILESNMHWIEKTVHGSKYRSTLERQYACLELYYHIWMSPWVFDNGKVLEAFGSVDRGDSVILYGAGAVGISIRNYLIEQGVHIADWVDGMYGELGQTLPVHNPKTADYRKADKVIITVLRYRAVEEIKKSLLEMGVEQCKIRWIENKYLEMVEE